MKNLITLKLNKEYKRAYFQGRFKTHPNLVTYMVKNHAGENRIGITTSTKIGKAVVRNRARRVIRAAYLSIRDQFTFPAGFDFVFVARPGTAAAKSTEISEIMSKQIRFLLENPPSGKRKSGKGKKPKANHE